MDALIVFSHLRWDFVFQRPQHLMARLARRWPVLFVEEPVFDAHSPSAERLQPAPGVTVLRPHSPLTAPGFHDAQIPLLQKLLHNTIADLGLTAYGAWLYTPMALPLLQGLSPEVIVYDCMDELKAFLLAPRQLVQRENALLKAANLVFTGGPTLYEARRHRHPRVHLFPSSVDADHFATARDPARSHADQAGVAGPRLGFFGVIDERFDADLVRDAAALRPAWQFCLVGPVVKIDEATLPRGRNLHYFGQRTYDELPAFLAGWDVALLPFARNEATRSISPTKTLEYLAADKPVVSTSIADVRRLYGTAVEFGDTPEEFVARCERLLDEDAAACSTRIAAARALVQATSWDDTAARMQTLIDDACADGLNDAAARMLGSDPRTRSRVAPRRPLPPRVECLIAGAGPTGLAAAHRYGAGSLLLERESAVGGWCRSIEDSGFTFDYAGHIMFSNDAYVQDLYRVLLGDNVHWQEREAWIYSHGVYTRYPFQGALHGLPPEVLKECLVGAIEARFGSIGRAADAPTRVDCCADGTDVPAAGGESGAARARRADPAPVNFEEFIYRTWGAGVAKHFAIPYNRKLWTVPLSEMETSWLGGRVPLPDLEEMIDGALRPVARPMGPNARFGYPLHGGFQALMNGFLPLLAGDLELDAEIARVSPLMHSVTLADGRRVAYDTLISTLPLPALVRMMGDEPPAEIRRAAAGLRHVSVRCVNLGICRARLSDKHWIYYPGDTVFHRVFLQGNASPHASPPGCFGLTCEITYSPTKPLPATGKALIDLCVADCVRVGLIDGSDPVLTANEVDMPCAYVVYDHGRAARVAEIRAWLAQFDIVTAGRYGEWAYYNSDHAFVAGRQAADAARELNGARVAAKSA